MVGKGNNKEYIEYSFLFPHYRDGKWKRTDCFKKGFKNILDKTIEQFSLDYKNQYTLHDLRRNVTLWLRGKGFNSSEVAYWLGHSEEVNESNYYALSDKQKQLMESILIKVNDKLWNTNHG